MNLIRPFTSVSIIPLGTIIDCAIPGVRTTLLIDTIDNFSSWGSESRLRGFIYTKLLIATEKLSSTATGAALQGEIKPIEILSAVDLAEITILEIFSGNVHENPTGAIKPLPVFPCLYMSPVISGFVPEIAGEGTIVLSFPTKNSTSCVSSELILLIVNTLWAMFGVKVTVVELLVVTLPPPLFIIIESEVVYEGKPEVKLPVLVKVATVPDLNW